MSEINTNAMTAEQEWTAPQTPPEAASQPAPDDDDGLPPWDTDDERLPWEAGAPGAPPAQEGGDEADGEAGGEAEGGGLSEDACRTELERLLESGFTMDELRAFSRDGDAQRAIAGGMSVAQAAIAFLRRAALAQAARGKRGVPTVRSAAAGSRGGGNMVEEMTDAQFRDFSRRAIEATLAGERVRL